jgi:hypothetical protein
MIALAAAALLALASGPAAAYQADLVPRRKLVESEDLAGAISIGGDDATIRVRLEGVNDARGEPVDGGRATVQVRLRVNGVRRRVTLAVPLDGGDGEATTSLGLGPDDRVVVHGVRVRGPDLRTIAEAGVVPGSTVSAPPPDPPSPPPTEECLPALATCQEDLAGCAQDLEECELDF